MTLYIDSPKTSLKLKNNGFLIENDDQKRLIMPSKVSQIIIGNGVFIQSDALLLAIQNQIPVYFEDSYGNIKMQCRSTEFALDALIRRKQLAFILNEKACIQWAKGLFSQKMENQSATVGFLSERKNRLKKVQTDFRKKAFGQIDKIKIWEGDSFNVFRDTVLGLEGSIARDYWRILADAVGESWKFEDRSRQPAKDPFNASLNYLYGMLYCEVENQIYLAGLDAHQGIFHAAQYQKPVLSFDFIELFRFWVDKLLVELIWSGELLPEYYETNEEQCVINKEAKGILIPAFRKMMNSRKMFLSRNTTVREHIRYAIEDLKQKF